MDVYMKLTHRYLNTYKNENFNIIKQRLITDIIKKIFDIEPKVICNQPVSITAIIPIME